MVIASDKYGRFSRLLLGIGLALSALLVLAACGGDPDSPDGTATPAEPAFDAEEFFSGKTIVIVDGFAAGGNSDTLARMFALVAQRHFPGNPDFEVRNIPGSGGLRGLEHTLQADPEHPTEFTLGMMHNRFVKQTIAGQPVAGFDLEETKWLGVPDLGITYRAVYANPDVANTWQEVIDSGQEITIGATAPGDTAGAGAQLMETLGGPMRYVYGYGGTSEILAAFDRGELDSMASGDEARVDRAYPEWIENQRIVPLFWWTAPFPQSYLDRLGAEEPVHLFDAIEMAGINLTDEQQGVFEVSENINLLSSRTFLLPPGTPDDVYQAVLEAWEATVQDPEFVEAKVAGGYDEGYVSADEIGEIIDSSQDLSSEGYELFRQLVGVID